MITHGIVDFGNKRLAFVEVPNGSAWLILTHELAPDERPNWLELEDRLMAYDPLPIPEAS